MRDKGKKIALWSAGLAVLVLAAPAWAEVLGRTTVPLDAREARTSESTLANLVADAARSTVGAKVALVQASQFRAQVIPVGDVTREALTEALLYPDERIVLVEVTGVQLRAALERSLSMLPKPSTGFLQVSGLAVSFRSAEGPNARVVELRVDDELLAPDRKYLAAMPASLAKGTLGYFRIFDGLEVQETGPAIGEAACSYVRAMETISPATGRLRDLSKPRA